MEAPLARTRPEPQPQPQPPSRLTRVLCPVLASFFCFAEGAARYALWPLTRIVPSHPRLHAHCSSLPPLRARRFRQGGRGAHPAPLERAPAPARSSPRTTLTPCRLFFGRSASTVRSTAASNPSNTLPTHVRIHSLAPCAPVCCAGMSRYGVTCARRLKPSSPRPAPPVAPLTSPTVCRARRPNMLILPPQEICTSRTALSKAPAPRAR